MSPPPRPPLWEERLAVRAIRRFSPGPSRRVPPADPPPSLAPFERFRIPRAFDGGTLDATFYPAPRAHSAVLLAHPGLEWGQAYFHRRGRIEALREAGFAALAFDFPGFGGSAPSTGFWDRSLADAQKALARRAAGLPISLWAVSIGGVGAHPWLSGGARVRAAVFEDVSPHLEEYGSRVGRAGALYKAAYRALPRTRAFLDLARHAPFLGVRPLYVVGSNDRGVPVASARRLAEAAEGELLVIEGARHLESIKVDGKRVIDAAIAKLIS